MARIAVLYCKRIQDHSCIACAKCYKAMAEKNGEYARHDTIELVAMTGCGDCPRRGGRGRPPTQRFTLTTGADTLGAARTGNTLRMNLASARAIREMSAAERSKTGILILKFRKPQPPQEDRCLHGVCGSSGIPSFFPSPVLLPVGLSLSAGPTIPCQPPVIGAGSVQRGEGGVGGHPVPH